jgi:hypothetical protein
LSKSPTQLTLERCRKLGWIPWIVERTTGRIKRDLWGFADVLVMDELPGSLAIQCTTTGHAPERVRKIRHDCRALALAWLAAGNRVEVWGWALRGARGKRKTWTLARWEIEGHGDEIHAWRND